MDDRGLSRALSGQFSAAENLCAGGSIARRLAVTPAAARVNIAVAGCNALAQSTGMANKHVRVLLVEAVWRLLRWQPNWHARQKYLEKLRVGASLKKKMAVALARQLAVDLWRWRTGRATAAELGWTVNSATSPMLGTNQ